MAALDILIKIATVVAHIVMFLLHSAQALLTLPFRGPRNAHLTAAKTSALVLKGWATGTGDAWRFHHRDYASALMLLPNECYQRFGRWMLFDDIVNYDSFNVIDRDKRVFVRDKAQVLHLATMPCTDWSSGEARVIDKKPDGCLKRVSRGIHPSDSHFVANRAAFDAALVPFGDDRIIQETSTYSAELIAEVRIALDEAGVAMPVDILSLAYEKYPIVAVLQKAAEGAATSSSAQVTTPAVAGSISITIPA